MQNRYVESFNGRMRDELLIESLFFGLVHARVAIGEWANDYNNFGPPPITRMRGAGRLCGSIAATG